MLDRTAKMLALSGKQVATGCAALSIFLMTASASWTQVASPPPSLGVQTPAQDRLPPQQSTPQQTEPAPPPENPGLINELGKLWDKSKSMLPTIKSPQEAIEDLNARTKDAGEGLSRLTKPSLMVT
ncbi:MAG: hypothetical protein Q7U92_21185, partial [Bradyrhizobium sp.]|nr:hypothetical protein [Bradyrhizobium sp.]